MARTYIKLPMWDALTLANNLTFGDAKVLDIRDTLRTALDPDDLHTNWIVTDVARWTGSSATYYGYAFVIRHMDGQPVPSATGHEWLFIFPGPGASYVSELEDILGLGVDATNQAYWAQIEDPTSYTAYDGNLAFHYSPVGGYAGGWDANGALVGGDLSVPTNSPWSAIATFMPATPQLKGLATRYQYNTISNIGVVADSDKPFLMVMCTEGRGSGPREVFIGGDLIVPYQGADTYTTSSLLFSLNWASGGAIYQEQHWVYSSLGVPETTSLYSLPSLTMANEKTADGSYFWDAVKVISSTEFKGYLDTDIFRVVGEVANTYMRIYDASGTKFLKIHDKIAFPYVADVPIFPLG